jgi:hypothetical protein
VLESRTVTKSAESRRAHDPAGRRGCERFRSAGGRGGARPLVASRLGIEAHRTDRGELVREGPRHLVRARAAVDDERRGPAAVGDAVAVGRGPAGDEGGSVTSSGAAPPAGVPPPLASAPPASPAAFTRAAVGDQHRRIHLAVGSPWGRVCAFVAMGEAICRVRPPLLVEPAPARPLKSALADPRAPQGILPIGRVRERIRDVEGQWVAVERRIPRHSDAPFRRRRCPTRVRPFGRKRARRAPPRRGELRRPALDRGRALRAVAIRSVPDRVGRTRGQGARSRRRAAGEQHGARGRGLSTACRR